jgi:nucleotidyltransferase/DNA polymerase involved in DNA repair
MEEGKEKGVAGSSNSDAAPTVDYQRYSSLFVFAGGNKAGMEAMDKAKQAEVIYEMSKNSSFFKRAQQLDEEAERRAASLKQVFQGLRGSNLRRMEVVAQNKLLEYEKRRSFEKICCVLDMDMFFAAVEIRDRPELKELPVAVGGDAMISTSNYVARKYGVRAAMPGFIAKKLCPHLVFVDTNFDKYKVVADQIRNVIARFDPQYYSLSLDEVYFDLTEAAACRFKQMNELTDRSPSVAELRIVAINILQEIRSEIKQITNGLTCSAGIAHNFFLAKICADVNKPDGQFELPPRREQVIEFLTDLPTRKIGGIGKVTEKILDKLDMKTVGDIRKFIPHILHAFKPASSEFLTRISIGVSENDGHEVLRPAADGVVTRKSIGCERTYSAKGISDPSELFKRLHDICSRVAGDMKKENLRGHAVTVKVKDVKFNLQTRCQSSRHVIQSCESIESLARGILESYLPINLRLLGVSVSKFDNAYDPQNSTASNRKLQNCMQSFLQLNNNMNTCSNNTGKTNSDGNSTVSERAVDVIDLLDDESSDDNAHFDADFGERGGEEESEEDYNDRVNDYAPNRNYLCPSKDTILLDASDGMDMDERHSTCSPSKKMKPEPTFNSSSHKFEAQSIKNSSIIDSSSDLKEEIVCIDLKKDIQREEKGQCDVPDVLQNTVCPICGATLPDNMTMINSHIDNCLERSIETKKRSWRAHEDLEVVDIVETKRQKSTISNFFKRKEDM